jgi:hypothetical protein
VHALASAQLQEDKGFEHRFTITQDGLGYNVVVRGRVQGSGGENAYIGDRQQPFPVPPTTTLARCASKQNAAIDKASTDLLSSPTSRYFGIAQIVLEINKRNGPKLRFNN